MITETYKKTTKSDFALFQSECKRWIERFGFYTAKFYYQHKDVQDDLDQIAYCIFPHQASDRVFTIGLSRTLNFNFKSKHIKHAAFHEIMEAFLYKIRNLADSRYLQPEEVDEEIHNIIRTLESVLLK